EDVQTFRSGDAPPRRRRHGHRHVVGPDRRLPREVEPVPAAGCQGHAPLQRHGDGTGAAGGDGEIRGEDVAPELASRLELARLAVCVGTSKESELTGGRSPPTPSADATACSFARPNQRSRCPRRAVVPSTLATRAGLPRRLLDACFQTALATSPRKFSRNGRSAKTSYSSRRVTSTTL